MTELEIVYKVLTTSIRGTKDLSDSVSERLIRNMILEVRSTLLLNYTSNGRKIPSSILQDTTIKVSQKIQDNGIYEGDIPELLDFGKNRSLVRAHDYSDPLSINYDNAQQTNMFSQVKRYKQMNRFLYNQRTNKASIELSPDDTDRVSKMDAVSDSADTTISGIAGFKEDYNIFVTASFYNPSDVASYDWEKDNLPLPHSLENPLVNEIRKIYNRAD